MILQAQKGLLVRRSKAQVRVRARSVVRVTATYILLVAFGIVFMLPFVWMLSSSLKSLPDVFVFPPQWIPQPPLWKNYYEALTTWPFLTWTANTLTVTVPVVVGTVLSSSLAGFALARLRGYGRNVLFALILATMMVPQQVTMIPTFLLFSKLGWVDTFKPLIVPAWFGDAFSIFLLRQFFKGIPSELDDAARIDGCSYLGIYRRIMLPLAKPALATVAIFSFMNTWNDFLGPLIYLNSSSKYTIALGLTTMQAGMTGETPWHFIMAASVVSVLPVIALFFLAQRLFIQGIVVTGVKG